MVEHVTHGIESSRAHSLLRPRLAEKAFGLIA